MEELHRAWEDAPVDPDWMMLSQGQLELGLTGQATAWADNGLDYLLVHRVLTSDLPSHRTWIALGRGDGPAARVAFDEYRAGEDEWARRWKDAEGNDVRRILSAPGRILRVELRALETLLTRLEQRE